MPHYEVVIETRESAAGGCCAQVAEAPSWIRDVAGIALAPTPRDAYGQLRLALRRRFCPTHVLDFLHVEQ